MLPLAIIVFAIAVFGGVVYWRTARNAELMRVHALTLRENDALWAIASQVHIRAMEYAETDPVAATLLDAINEGLANLPQDIVRRELEHGK